MIHITKAKQYLQNDFGLIVPFSVTGYLQGSFAYQMFDLFAPALKAEMARIDPSLDYLSDTFYDRIDQCLAERVKRLHYVPDYQYTHGYIMNFLAQRPLDTRWIQPSTQRLTDLSCYLDTTGAAFTTAYFPVFATLSGDKLLSVCGVNDFDGDFRDGQAEIAVATASGAAGRGFALSNVVAMTNELIGQGMEVSYLCSCDNKASARLAMKAGFRLISRDYHYVCYERERS